jgi:hypothetical protein
MRIRQFDREKIMLKKITTAAVGAALILPGVGSATAAANDMPMRDGGDRYELVSARSAGVHAQAPRRWLRFPLYVGTPI